MDLLVPWSRGVRYRSKWTTASDVGFLANKDVWGRSEIEQKEMGRDKIDVLSGTFAKRVAVHPSVRRNSGHETHMSAHLATLRRLLREAISLTTSHRWPHTKAILVSNVAMVGERSALGCGDVPLIVMTRPHVLWCHNISHHPR